MKSRARILVDKSVEAMLASVEVYNKPAFSYREEAFAILAINSWELLLKARVLQLDRNRLSAILVYETKNKPDGTKSAVLYRKKNRAGNYMTLSLFQTHDRIVTFYKDNIDPAVRTNLEALVELRDNAIHFFNKDFDLTKGIHEIGAATVKNYTSASRQWFGVDLSAYRIFLMPLAFLSAPTGVDAINLRPEEQRFRGYLNSLRGGASNDPTRDFNVGVDIEVRVRRTRDKDATPVIISNAPDAIRVTMEEADIRERYPWSYKVLTARLKDRYSDFKQNSDYHRRRKSLEADPALCSERLLDPGNPSGVKMKFYSSNMLRVFDSHYERRRSDQQVGSIA